MPDIHTIRLKHPWTCEPQERGVCWRRSFNWPAGLTPREAARIVVEDLPEEATVELNGQQLQDDFDITAILASFNELAIYLPQGEPTTETECPYAVCLEINEG